MDPSSALTILVVSLYLTYVMLLALVTLTRGYAHLPRRAKLLLVLPEVGAQIARLSPRITVRQDPYSEPVPGPRQQPGLAWPQRLIAGAALAFGVVSVQYVAVFGFLLAPSAAQPVGVLTALVEVGAAVLAARWLFAACRCREHAASAQRETGSSAKDASAKAKAAERSAPGARSAGVDSTSDADQPGLRRSRPGPARKAR